MTSKGIHINSVVVVPEPVPLSFNSKQFSLYKPTGTKIYSNISEIGALMIDMLYRSNIFYKMRRDFVSYFEKCIKFLII